MKFYRYEKDIFQERVIGDNPRLRCNEYDLHKETEKGYWIGYGVLGEGKIRSQSKWISKESNKRFAYPTKEEALENYYKRTSWRIKFLKQQLRDCEYLIARAIEEQNNLNK